MQTSSSLSILYKTFEKYPLEQFALNIYGLADAAQDTTFLQKLKHLKQKCLLKEAAGDKAKAVSPHLLQLPKNFADDEWEWIEKQIAGTPAMTIIVTPLSFDILYQHLRQFLDVQFEDGLEMILAFWDPLVLAPLLSNKDDQTLYVKGPIFNELQVKQFLLPIQSWWYWNRLGQLKMVIGESKKQHELLKVQTPIPLDHQQEAMLVENSFPNTLIYYLRLNNQYLIEDISDQDLYSLVIKTIPKAREYHLFGMRDVLNFICLKLTYKEHFNDDPVLHKYLPSLKDKQISMDDVMTHLIDENKDQITP